MYLTSGHRLPTQGGETSGIFNRINILDHFILGKRVKVFTPYKSTLVLLICKYC